NFSKAFRQMRKDTDSMFEDAEKMVNTFELSEFGSAKVTASDNLITITANVAGVDPKHIEVACNGAGVTITSPGKKKLSFSTGDALKSQDLRASYHRGLLTITVPIYTSPRIIAQV